MKADRLPDELAFLADLASSRQQQYRSAPWLKNPFDSNQWRCQFSTRYWLDIDFDVLLEDGLSLTSPKHAPLLETLKTWLCVQTHADATGGNPATAQTAYARISTTLQLIDYLLLNDKRFGISNHGLLAMTQANFAELLFVYGSSREVHNGLYAWPSRLAAFLRQEIGQLSDAEVAKAIAEHSCLRRDVPPPEDWLLDFSEDEVIRARYWLFLKGLYTRGRANYRLQPNSNKLCSLIYPGRLKRSKVKTVAVELCLLPRESCRRELPAAPVSLVKDDRMDAKRFGSARRIVRRLGLLARIDLPVPIDSLDRLESIEHSLDLKESGRFRNLPAKVVFSSLRNAIEFSLSYGDDIVDSYLRIARAAEAAGSSVASYGRRNDIAPFLSEGVRSLGVERWSISFLHGRLEHDEFFRVLRSRPGLHQLIVVLYGSVQICVGTLMARRQSELCDLVADSCLDRSGTRLLFRNRKSGDGEMRELEARPIPEIGARLIRLLVRLQNGLIEFGFLDSHVHLFRYPCHAGTGPLVLSEGSTFNRANDLFCDYFQVAQNAQGQRYYVRQHPLRRFFAMLFFWGNSFAGMDVLRWFLGHTDVTHLYHYITEVTPGAMLRGVKAQYACEQTKVHADAAADLASLLESRYGTRDFSVLDDDELTQYIEELMEEGRVVVEPEFLETPDGQAYRILIQVVPEKAHASSR